MKINILKKNFLISFLSRNMQQMIMRDQCWMDISIVLTQDQLMHIRMVQDFGSKIKDQSLKRK